MNRSSDLTDQFPTITSIIKSGVVVATLSVLVLTLKLEFSVFGFRTDTISLQFMILTTAQYMCFVFFIGRLVCSPFAYGKHFRKYNNQNLKSGKSSAFTTFYLLVPATLKTAEVMLWLYGLATMTPSTVLMASQIGGIMYPLFKRVFLGRPIFVHVKFGLILCAISWFLISQISFQEMNIAKVESYFTKFHLVVLASVLGALRDVYHKWLRKSFESSTYRINGLEGLYQIAVFSLFQGMVVYRGLSSVNVVESAFRIDWGQDQIIITVVLFILGSFYELLKAGFTRKLRGVTFTGEFFMLSLFVVVELKFDFYGLNSLDFMIVSALLLFRYIIALFYLAGRLIIDEDIEIRRWGLSEQLRKYRVQNYPDSGTQLNEEFSIMDKI